MHRKHTMATITCNNCNQCSCSPPSAPTPVPLPPKVTNILANQCCDCNSYIPTRISGIWEKINITEDANGRSYFADSLKTALIVRDENGKIVNYKEEITHDRTVLYNNGLTITLTHDNSIVFSYLGRITFEGDKIIDWSTDPNRGAFIVGSMGCSGGITVTKGIKSNNALVLSTSGGLFVTGGLEVNGVNANLHLNAGQITMLGNLRSENNLTVFTKSFFDFNGVLCALQALIKTPELKGDNSIPDDNPRIVIVTDDVDCDCSETSVAVTGAQTVASSVGVFVNTDPMSENVLIVTPCFVELQQNITARNVIIIAGGGIISRLGAVINVAAQNTVNYTNNGGFVALSSGGDIINVTANAQASFTKTSVYSDTTNTSLTLNGGTGGSVLMMAYNDIHNTTAQTYSALSLNVTATGNKTITVNSVLTSDNDAGDIIVSAGGDIHDFTANAYSAVDAAFVANSTSSTINLNLNDITQGNGGLISMIASGEVNVNANASTHASLTSTTSGTTSTVTATQLSSGDGGYVQLVSGAEIETIANVSAYSAATSTDTAPSSTKVTTIKTTNAGGVVALSENNNETQIDGSAYAKVSGNIATVQNVIAGNGGYTILRSNNNIVNTKDDVSASVISAPTPSGTFSSGNGGDVNIKSSKGISINSGINLSAFKNLVVSNKGGNLEMCTLEYLTILGNVDSRGTVEGSVELLSAKKFFLNNASFLNSYDKDNAPILVAFDIKADCSQLTVVPCTTLGKMLKADDFQYKINDGPWTDFSVIDGLNGLASITDGLENYCLRVRPIEPEYRCLTRSICIGCPPAPLTCPASEKKCCCEKPCCGQTSCCQLKQSCCHHHSYW